MERIRSYCAFVAAGIGGKDPLAKKLPPDIGTAEDRRGAIGKAIRSGHFTQREIAEHFDVSLGTVRRIAK